MSLVTIVAANLTTTGVGLLIVAVSLNRLLGMLWPFALVVPLIPVFLLAYSGYPDAVYLWSYLPIGLAIYVRKKVGTFPRDLS
ncbi:hypothetical protein BJI69_21310 [Luteibacter rhizovicinus DSM 16549]|uniref:Uncharacterized protein n=1 Tax=Luteibacter rhizovicinus DSM 16549 TaxID=1440763 RepID=A0A1L3EYT0_9GAMM|nr:hypothetical protein [Luteibacter rhizovicinus]APG06192.1 hypothetical protein BJI69_21310 [Luteibacter rhizovicinus DSM 16549]KLD77453.1 hypothetical protein Y886_15645 [Xanthomonas hyacinthi DSM 19077]